MSFETITITRQFPIVNGFVQLPNNLEKNRSMISLEEALVALPTAVLVKMTAEIGGRRLAGGKFGVQEWLETDEAFACCPVDTGAETLKDEIPNNTTITRGDDPPPGDREWNEPPCETECRAIGGEVSLTWTGAVIGRCCAGGVMTGNSVDLTFEDYCTWMGSIDGFAFTIQLIVNDDGTCYWLLTVTCESDSVIIWSGVKLVGSTPAGSYTSNDPTLCSALQLTDMVVSLTI